MNLEIATSPHSVTRFLPSDYIFRWLEKYDLVCETKLLLYDELTAGFDVRQPSLTRALSDLPQAPRIMDFQWIGVEANSLIHLFKSQPALPTLTLSVTPVPAHGCDTIGLGSASCNFINNRRSISRCPCSFSGSTDSFDDDDHNFPDNSRYVWQLAVCFPDWLEHIFQDQWFDHLGYRITEGKVLFEIEMHTIYVA